MNESEFFSVVCGLFFVFLSFDLFAFAPTVALCE